MLSRVALNYHDIVNPYGHRVFKNHNVLLIVQRVIHTAAHYGANAEYGNKAKKPRHDKKQQHNNPRGPNAFFRRV
jgi:hypothetical protein